MRVLVWRLSERRYDKSTYVPSRAGLPAVDRPRAEEQMNALDALEDVLGLPIPRELKTIWAFTPSSPASPSKTTPSSRSTKNTR